MPVFFPAGSFCSLGTVSSCAFKTSLSLPDFLLWLPPIPSTPCLIPTCPQVELSDGTSHTITDAYAGKEYIIQVAAKDNDIGTWSNWSVAVHATPWTEEPKHLTTEVQITETTSTSTSSFMPPPTTKICDKGAGVGSGAVAVCWTAGLVLAAYGVLFI
ncbi:ciliary neurotrophic factor receptor subunit alpha-like [Tympanuchus pallidicinctus]|uniref:ciliary neurotrophic factor receptor subunit alpha-like n=1 Tax=Tympanuchus pallidicinctus TaxID=109042 RepID=UPI002286F216|nr:ciliary neurotrophic factor receptor subunit alpha-like [Tympanuchus pallidicinctus]